MLEVKPAQVKAAYKKVDAKLVDALKLAAEANRAIFTRRTGPLCKLTLTEKPDGWSGR